jgi:hypothetical protein
MNTVAPKPDKEILTPLQRWLELLVVVLTLLFFSFLLYHQWANTGFFTEKFGALEMLCLYGPLLLGLTAPFARVITGQRNPARPFEAATSLCLALGSLWLLNVFPFNFRYLADALPEGIRFILAWVTDDMGKIIMILQVIIGSITALVAMWHYFTFRLHHPAAAL